MSGKRVSQFCFVPCLIQFLFVFSFVSAMAQEFASHDLDEIRAIKRATGTAPILAVDETSAIPGEFFVIFESDVPTTQIKQLADSLSVTHDVEIHSVYNHAVNGFWATLSDESVKTLELNPNVLYIEPTQVYQLYQLAWGKDRMNQRDLPLDGNSSFDRSAFSVTVHLIDSGVNNHNELLNVPILLYDYTGEGRTDDCYGHGTGVASVIAGATFGVAYPQRIVSHRVATCAGYINNAWIVNALNGIASTTLGPEVVNMSLGGPASATIDMAVNNLAGKGTAVVAAAGNNGSDACGYSPARAVKALTVGMADNLDRRPTASNYGKCVDLFAPGVSIPVANNAGGNTWHYGTGTSFAAPHVTGTAAVYLNGNQAASVAEVTNALMRASSYGRLSNIAYGTPNLNLYVSFPTCRVPLFRYWTHESDKGDHHYTTDWNEMRAGKGNAWGYVFEKVEGYVSMNSSCYASGSVPLYRYWSGSNFDHFFTTAYGSYPGYVYEGITGYVYPVSNQAYGTMPNHRYWSGSYKDHFYTVTYGSYGSYIYEGIEGYLFPEYH